MAIPNRQAAVEAAKGLYPRAWQHCHVAGDPEAWDFIILCARYMQTTHGDAAFNYGMNAKRGNVNDPSMDVIYVRAAHETDGVYDVVGGAGGGNPQPSWNYLGPGENTTSGWLDPFAWETHYPYDDQPPEPPTPCPEPMPPPSYESLGGDETGKQITRILESDYKRAGRPGLDGESGAWTARTYYDAGYGGLGADAAIAKHRPEWCAALGIPPA